MISLQSAIHSRLKNAKYNEISHYQAINIELSPDGYRGDLMNEVSKFRYNKLNKQIAE
ncbi:hypothetical protein ES705_25864 [subsurface metagenome]